MDNPSEEFVKFFASRVFSGPLTEKRRETFTGLATRAFAQFVNDKINQRLKFAISPEVSTDSEPQDMVKDKNDEAPQRERSIATITSEIEGYYIVKSLLRNLVDPKRIVYRDTQSYCGILLDDNNRKPLAQLYFNNESNKQIGLFDSSRNEEKIHINALNDIFFLEDKLKNVLALYEAGKWNKSALLDEKIDSSRNSTESTQTSSHLETVAKEMRQKYVESGRKPATDEEINNARTAFYKTGGKW